MYLIYIIFFFFKQKTAYEMRISDWSSDVCSSDLKTVRFDRITLCESPVNRNFPWRDSYEEDRFIRLRNERAAKDYAVGFGANFLGQLLSIFRLERDIGDGGRVGFDQHPLEAYSDVAFLPGDHSIGTQPGNDQFLAEFVTGNDDPDATRPTLPKRSAALNGFANIILIPGTIFILVLIMFTYLMISQGAY